MNDPQTRLWADLSLLAVSVLWGGTFLLVKHAVENAAVQPLLCVRFALAAVVLSGVFPRTLREMTRTELLVGVMLGLFLWMGYACQTEGLRWLDSSKAAFLTGVGLVLVPMVGLLLGRAPTWAAVVGTLVAAAGLTLMSLKTDVATGENLMVFGRGEWLLMGCAGSFAFHIVIQGDYAPFSNVRRLAVVQIAVTALLAGAASVLQPTSWEGQPGPSQWTWHTWAAIAFLGVFATALAFTVQVWAQRMTPPTHTALLLTLEPLSAALFGWLAGEALTPTNWLGCGLIIVGILAAEFRGSGNGAESGQLSNPIGGLPSDTSPEPRRDAATAVAQEKPI